jgi:hypothetical protein
MEGPSTGCCLFSIIVSWANNNDGIDLAVVAGNRILEEVGANADESDNAEADRNSKDLFASLMASSSMLASYRSLELVIMGNGETV